MAGNLNNVFGDDTSAAPLPFAETSAPKRRRTSTAPTMNAAPTPVVRKKEETVKIMLEENENIPPTGQYISVNGRSFILRAGEEVLVPRTLLNVLDDAVMSTPSVDPVTMQVMGYRNKSRFPYRIINDRG